MPEVGHDPKSLIMAIRQGDVSTRWRAAVELARAASPTAVDALVGALASDRSARVREEAARGLGTLGLGPATGALIVALRTDREAHVREAAAEALGRIGDPAAVEALARALEDRHVMVRKEAAAALASLGAAQRVAHEHRRAGLPVSGVPDGHEVLPDLGPST